MTEWCILRTASASTLRLVEALRNGGYDAWTPVEMVDKRARKVEKRAIVPSPLMPTFVFAQADRLRDLAALARSPAQTYQVWDATLRRMVTKGWPFFSILRSAGEFALIPDRALNPLRLAEQRQKPTETVRTFQPGEVVRMTDGGFAGLSGVVVETVRKSTVVRFGDPGMLVKVETWVLAALDEAMQVHVNRSEAERAIPDGTTA